MTRSTRNSAARSGAEIQTSYRRSFSVQSKLIAAFVLLTLVSIGVVSSIGYVSARESLRAAAERELMGMQRSRAAMIQNVLATARSEALSLFEASPRLARDTGYTLEVHRRALQSARSALRHGSTRNSNS
jgi:hypothetical protein